jgi:hypothetical protein
MVKKGARYARYVTNHPGAARHPSFKTEGTGLHAHLKHSPPFQGGVARANASAGVVSNKPHSPNSIRFPCTLPFPNTIVALR